jgi:hypothetical protein
VTQPGFAEDVLPVTVRRDQVVESSRLLEESSEHGISAGLWDDFDQRLRWKPITSALITGSELRASGATIPDALPVSPEFIKKQLTFSSDGVCLFVNGTPRPGMTLNMIRIEDVRAIEVYSDQIKDQMVIGLQKLWPPKLKCGDGFGEVGSDTRRPKALNSTPIRPKPPAARWIVIWTK